MTKANNIIHVLPLKKNRYASLIIWATVFFTLLLLRDAYSFGINKNIFILITCFCAVTMKTTHLIYLFCFLFPLYVGLPGNYMTLILIVRILIGVYKIKASTFIITILVSVFMFIQNMVTGNTGIVQMMFIAGVILVSLLFTVKDDLDPTVLVVMYSAGVASLGYIMLTSTLNVYGLSDLMSTSFRLGSASVDYVDAGIMNISVDPNFYGMFSIAAISTAVPLALKANVKPFIRICLCCFTFVQIAVCLIGLSRAFVLVFVSWLLLYSLSQKSIKGAAITSIAVIAVIVFVVTVMPDVLNAVLARFKDSDMATGNGRISLILEFLAQWGETIVTILFGVGLFNCNVHCMPLQFLFGGGLVLFVLMIALASSYKSANPSKMTLSNSLPLIVTFAMMCTVPAAGLINYMFPLVFIGLVMPDNGKEV